MPKPEPTSEHVKLHRSAPSEESNIILERAPDDVQVVVTQLFCPAGHNLVGLSPESFDGFPGISLWVEHEGKAGLVVVSPVHGDHDKRGATFPEGAKLTIRCPTCRIELPTLTPCRCTPGAEMRKLYLTPQRSEAHLVAVCDIWGCHRSRVIDSYEMFSEYLAGNIGDDQPDC